MRADSRPGRGDPAIDEMRSRVLVAARSVLLEHAGAAGVSLDTIAARAGVARTIVHQQFGSLAAVLEALFDRVVEQSCLSELQRTFQLPDPIETLLEVVAVYAKFWDGERELFRRLHAIAVFDVELRAALHRRAEQRRQSLSNLARRLAQLGLHLSADAQHILCALTSFELLDGVAGSERTIIQIAPLARAFARTAIPGGAPARFAGA